MKNDQSNIDIPLKKAGLLSFELEVTHDFLNENT